MIEMNDIGMYWHYIYKFLYALYRYYTLTFDASMLQLMLQLIENLHPLFFIPQEGYRWKINVDGTPINGPQHVSPTDNLSAYVMYTLINHVSAGALKNQIHDLNTLFIPEIHEPDQVRLSPDPLNLGETAFLHQWLRGPSQNLHRVLIKQTT